MKQRLAAILAADAAGYSRLMAADQKRALAALEAGREIFVSLVREHAGRIVDTAGDSVLAVFGSATGRSRRRLRSRRGSRPPSATCATESASTSETSPRSPTAPSTAMG